MNAVKRYFRSPAAVTGLVLLLIVVAMAISAGWLYPREPLSLAGRPLIWPFSNPRFLLGTDNSGRDIAAQFIRLPSLGWTVVLEINGQVVAAPAPLRPLDAAALAAAVVASRAGDAEPDRAGLANLLRRASHLVADLGDRLERLELPRIVVGGRASRTVVVDAWCELATDR